MRPRLHKTMIVHPNQDFGAQIDQAVDEAIALLAQMWAETTKTKVGDDFMLALVSYDLTTIAGGGSGGSTGSQYPPVMIRVLVDVDVVEHAES